MILGALNSDTGELSLMSDSAQASSSKVLDEMVSQPISVSQNGRDVIFTSRSGMDLFGNGSDYSSECTLTPTADAPPFGTYSNPPTYAFWIKPDATVQNYLGYYTNVSTCQNHMFAWGSGSRSRSEDSAPGLWRRGVFRHGRKRRRDAGILPHSPVVPCRPRGR